MSQRAGHNPHGGSSHSSRTIILIGMRGAGKTTVGLTLGELLGTAAGGEPAPYCDTFAFGGVWSDRFVDIDSRIVSAAGLSIAKIFAQQGESGFRQLERAAIEQVCETPPRVLSVGGGAILDKQNVAALKRIGVLFWLTAPAEVLWDRIRKDPQSKASRPALVDPAPTGKPPAGPSGLREMEILLARRAGDYRRAADRQVDTVGRSPVQIAQTILTLFDD